MIERSQRVLVVDDEAFNLKILQSDLEDFGYKVVKASDGKEACDILKKDKKFDVIILDRMMPRMDGMETLAWIKKDKALTSIPVIMQTAAASSKEVQEGIEAGVFYYLTKPFEANVMLALVKSAIHDSKQYRTALDKRQELYHALCLLDSGTFSFRTLDDVKSLSYAVSELCRHCESVLVGLSELMINAIEHGNLGITFEEKTAMMFSDSWVGEVERRLGDLKFKDNIATFTFKRKKDLLHITIEDMGGGFDWRPFLKMSLDRAVLPNGRGMLMAKAAGFESLEYFGCGNKVACVIKTKDTAAL